MNDQKNNTNQLLCINEKQVTWCIALSIIALCSVMIISYMTGYRTAIRNVVDAAKKDSFSDHVFTQVTAHALQDNEGYYILCKALDKESCEHIIQQSKEEKCPLSLAHTTNDQTDETSYHLISEVVVCEKDLKKIETFLTNKTNIQHYDIITVQKTQKLKGYVS